MLPFSERQFFEVFAVYNATIWPVQLAAYAAAALAVAAILWPRPWSGRAVAAVLAALWLWTGIVYHWLFFSAINPLATVFALAFVAQGLAFVVVSARRGLVFAAEDPVRRRTGLALVAYAALIYPLLGALFGHAYPATPTFGVTPCPLVIFTFGVLLLAAPPVPRRLLLVPLAWAVVGGSAAVLLGVPQDWMLPVAGLLSGTLFMRSAGSR